MKDGDEHIWMESTFCRVQEEKAFRPIFYDDDDDDDGYIKDLFHLRL